MSSLTLFMDLHGVLVETPRIFMEYKRITLQHLHEQFGIAGKEAEKRYDEAMRRWEDVAFEYLRNPTKTKVGPKFLEFLETCDKLFPKFLYENLKVDPKCSSLRTRPFEYEVAAKTEEVLYPEVRDTLDALIDHGYNLIVASSSHSSHINGVIEANDIEDYFSEVIGFDSVAATKHTVDYYQNMLSVANSKPENSVMVGNSMHEVLKPRLLGMKTIHINRERSVPLQVRKLADLSLGDISLLPIHLDVIELM
ncbi:MAG: HAD family hydrolase [Candidatus Heimdallarchaeota archaeon]|nr:HAD family hydrolase [Candidatus Heimdallarchaeota archaeon]